VAGRIWISNYGQGGAELLSSHIVGDNVDSHSYEEQDPPRLYELPGHLSLEAQLWLHHWKGRSKKEGRVRNKRKEEKEECCGERVEEFTCARLYEE
jgi:hypothetical protein